MIFISKEDVKIYGNYYVKDGIGYKRVTVLSLDDNMVTYANGHLSEETIKQMEHKDKKIKVAKKDKLPRLLSPDTIGLWVDHCSLDELHKTMGGDE